MEVGSSLGHDARSTRLADVLVPNWVLTGKTCSFQHLCLLQPLYMKRQQLRWLKTGNMPAMMLSARSRGGCACLCQSSFMVVGALKHRPTFLNLLAPCNYIKWLLVPGHFCSLWQIKQIECQSSVVLFIGNWLLVSSPMY